MLPASSLTSMLSCLSCLCLFLSECASNLEGSVIPHEPHFDKEAKHVTCPPLAFSCSLFLTYSSAYNKVTVVPPCRRQRNSTSMGLAFVYARYSRVGFGSISSYAGAGTRVKPVHWQSLSKCAIYWSKYDI